MLDTSTTKGKFLLITLLIVLVIDVTLKGFALWRASRNKHKIWFILILIFESAGILPLIYLLWFTRDWEKKD